MPTWAGVVFQEKSDLTCQEELQRVITSRFRRNTQERWRRKKSRLSSPPRSPPFLPHSRVAGSRVSASPAAPLPAHPASVLVCSGPFDGEVYPLAGPGGRSPSLRIHASHTRSPRLERRAERGREGHTHFPTHVAHPPRSSLEAKRSSARTWPSSTPSARNSGWRAGRSSAPRATQSIMRATRRCSWTKTLR